jgi:hypothetical protein
MIRNFYMLHRLLLAVALAMGLTGTGLAADYEHHVLTVAMVEKFMTADAELKKLIKPEARKNLGVTLTQET